MGKAEELFKEWQKVKEKEDILKMRPEVLEWRDVINAVDHLESEFKDAMKEELVDMLESAAYRAVFTIRHGAPSIAYNIPAIEEQPWGAGCIIKAIDGKVFGAIAKAKELDVSLYQAETPGKEIKVVTITKLAA